MQLEFDDTEVAKPFEIEVLWNPIDDDFQPKAPEVFERGVGFAEGRWMGRSPAVSSLRGGSAPGADDDLGNPGGDGLEAARCDGPDRGQTASRGLRGSLCTKRREFPGAAVNGKIGRHREPRNS